MEKMGKIVEGMKPVIVMVIVSIFLASCAIFYKLGANDGMNLRILVAYRFLFASAFIAPLAFYLERKSRPQLTWTVLFQGFLCGLLGGTLAQNTFAASLALTSSTFSTAMSNLTPAITYVMAITFRLEKRNWSTLAGKAKVIGTLVGMGGAMLLTFYKGPEIKMWSTHIDISHKNNQVSKHGNKIHQNSINQLLGGLLAFGSCVAMASWYIVQAKMAKNYPCPYSITALMAITAAIQSVVVALCTERNWNEWKLGWNIRLLTVSYLGIVGSGLMFSLVAWCIRVRGPHFASSFNPVMLVAVAIGGSLLLDEKMHFGWIIGSILIVMGLYMVIWGKSKEMKPPLDDQSSITNSKNSFEFAIDNGASKQTNVKVDMEQGN